MTSSKSCDFYEFWLCQDMYCVGIGNRIEIPTNVTPNPGGSGALPYKLIRDVPFFRVSFSRIIPERGMKIDRKFRDRL